MIRFHYPLIVPKNPEDCWIEIGGHHFFWQEGEPLVFDDTREHWVKNQTEETRVVLIIDFDANMPFPVNLYTTLRYNLIRHSTEVKAVRSAPRSACRRAPRRPRVTVSQGVISMASHTDGLRPSRVVMRTAALQGAAGSLGEEKAHDVRDQAASGRRSCRAIPVPRSGPARRA